MGRHRTYVLGGTCPKGHPLTKPNVVHLRYRGAATPRFSAKPLGPMPPASGPRDSRSRRAMSNLPCDVSPAHPHFWIEDEPEQEIDYADYDDRDDDNDE
jgi:hypothetical protein